jgi:hypothetical protein
MKITAIETISLNEFPNVLRVHLHTEYLGRGAAGHLAVQGAIAAAASRGLQGGRGKVDAI